MIKSQLREFIERVVDTRTIAQDDVRFLVETVLEDGIGSRDEAEALLSLERALAAPESFRAVLSALVVDFVVWGSRPTGRVMQDDAAWLAATLDLGGPNPTAMRIAEAIAAEADQVDEALVSFILRGRQEARTLAAA
jgi:hypothetical protein